MKKVIPVLLLSILTCTVFAQHNKAYEDSIKHYEQEINKIRLAFHDSLQHDPEYIRLTEQLNTLKKNGDSYASFSIFFTRNSADFNRFNAQHGVSGFSPLQESMTGIGFGFSSKRNRLIFDFNFGSIGLNKTAMRGDEKIKTSFSGLLHLEFGYDFIKSSSINLYPFAGLGLRSSLLEYQAPANTNPLFSDASDIIQNNRSFEAYTTELGYQAGIGMEFVISKPGKPGGTLLFLKSGTNMPFKRKVFEIEGINYDPDFKYAHLNFAVGFKFFGR